MGRLRMQITLKGKAELAEKELEKSCSLNKVKYIAPSENESLRERKNRKAKLKRLLKSKEGESKKLNPCVVDAAKINPVEPCEKESPSKREKRKVKAQLTWERKAELAEKELEKSCTLNEVKYILFF